MANFMKTTMAQLDPLGMVTKALQSLERQVLRGFMANMDVDPALVINFQYNPETIADNKTVNYVDQTPTICGSSPGKFYVGGGDRTIGFKFKLHGLEQGMDRFSPSPEDNGISTELAKLRSFLYPKSDAWSLSSNAGSGGMRMSSPPRCLFGFGNRILEGTITQLQIEETQFNSVLAPVRAEVSVTFVVNESEGNAYHMADRKRRLDLAGRGMQNIPFPLPRIPPYFLP